MPNAIKRTPDGSNRYDLQLITGKIAGHCIKRLILIIIVYIYMEVCEGQHV